MNSITIKDVAELAGVSMKTVSRVLNNEPHVRPGMREKVLSAVRALDYKPNFAARALAGTRAYLLGLYFDLGLYLENSENPTADYVGALQTGVMNTCRQAGYHLLVEQIDSEAPHAGKQVLNLLSTVKVDGLILPPPICDQSQVLDALDAQHMPYVRIAPAKDIDRGPCVQLDDRRAAYEMTQHLVSFGHRRIGFVRGHHGHSATELRTEGYRLAMREAGIEVLSDWIQQGNFSFLSGVRAAERLLSLPERPTAIFASNDVMALGAMAVANRMHLSIPDELSLAGFDDSSSARVVWPRLSTIRQPIEQMASEAATMLIQGLTATDVRKTRLMDFALVQRESTGPAKQS